MKRVFCKSLGILLTVIMMACFIPSTLVLAAEDEEIPVYSVEEVINAIKSLPDVDDVTYKDLDKINDVLIAIDYYEEKDDFNTITAAFPDVDLYEYLNAYLEKFFVLTEELTYDFMDAVDNIPDLDELTLDDEFAIRDAVIAYNKLPQVFKDYLVKTEVTYYTKLMDSQKKFRELQEAEDEEAASRVIEMIDALPAVDDLTLDDEEVVTDARNAFEELSEHAKTLVENFDVLYAAEERIDELKEEEDAEYTAEEVIEMIKALPDPADVTTDDSLAITDAWIAYVELPESQKEKVGEELFNKIMDCNYAQARSWLEETVYYAELFVENYSDQMTEEQIAAIKTNIESSKKVLADDEKDIDLTWLAVQDLEKAIWDANDEIWKNFTIVEGDGIVWLMDSDKGITIRIKQEGYYDWAYELFMDGGCELLIDGEAIPEGAANYSHGSLIIEIIPDFLKTLSVGDHKLTVKFDNDVTMDIVFTVKAASPVPASGELVSPAVYVGIAMVVLAASGFVVNKCMAKKES